MLTNSKGCLRPLFGTAQSTYGATRVSLLALAGRTMSPRPSSETRIAVLFVSEHFLASEFITTHELPRLLDAARTQGVTIFWIYLGSCLWEQTEIRSYQAAHDVSRPLRELDKPRRDATMKEISAKLLELSKST